MRWEIEDRIWQLQTAFDSGFSLLYITNIYDSDYYLIKGQLLDRGYDLSESDGELYIKTSITGNSIYRGKE